DDLMTERARARVEAVPPPVLSVEPVAVPPAGEVGRRAARQRLLELEDVARRNLRSAEEARRVLAEEHRRLEFESNARSEAEAGAAALAKEVNRLRDGEGERNSTSNRSAMERELKRAKEQHERDVAELDRLRGSVGSSSAVAHDDGVLEEYASRLREEQ